jgi:hypothetical protein
MTEADVRRIAKEVVREVLREDRGGHRASASASDSEPTVARHPKAAKVPKAASQPSEVASAPARKSRASTKSAAISHGSLDAITAWWPAASTTSTDHLNLVYAGEAASEKAVVLMFASELGDATAAGSNIEVLNAKGKPASGGWSAGTNPRLLVFRGVTPGRYTVILKPTLADAAGKTLATELHGPVYVH